MALGKNSIKIKTMWTALLLFTIILVGCGTKENPQTPTHAPTNVEEPSFVIASPTPLSAVKFPSETPALSITSSPATQPTLAPSATNPPVETPTETPEPALTAIPLTEWIAWGWTQSTSPMACQDVNNPCWMLTNYKEQSSLVYAEPVYLDAASPNLSLVFQTRYSVKESKAFGFVEIQVVGEAAWNRVYTLKGSRDYWHEVAIDLSPFSGKAVTIRFATKPFFDTILSPEATKTIYNKETWIIQNVVIEPKKPTNGALPGLFPSTSLKGS